MAAGERNELERLQLCSPLACLRLWVERAGATALGSCGKRKRERESELATAASLEVRECCTLAYQQRGPRDNARETPHGSQGEHLGPPPPLECLVQRKRTEESSGSPPKWRER